VVVRLTDGREAVRAYVSEHASHGLDHVIELVTGDNNRILTLIGDLTEDEGMTVTPADEWRVYDALRHMTGGLDRSKDRLLKLSGGQPFVNPPGVTGGGMGAEYASFGELRRSYIDGMAEILGVLRKADGTRNLAGTSEHVSFGPFNWLEWGIYSHHVHTHDHVGQIENIRKALRA
jgi:hypothetical protein